MSDSPSLLYRLSEDAGSTGAGDTSGNQGPSLTYTTTGFSGAGTPGTATFDGSKVTFVAGSLGANGGLGGNTTRTTTAGTWVVAFSNTQSDTLVPVWGASPGTTANTGDWILGTNLGNIHSSAAGITGPAVNDGAKHVAHLVLSGGTATLYLDGASVGSAALASVSWRDQIGGRYEGSVWDVAFYDGTALSAGRVATQASAILNGLAGESSTTRLSRFASYANIPVGTLDTSLTNVPAQDFSSERTAWDAIQEVADAEAGVTFVDESGSLDFHNRQRVSLKTSPDLTLTSTFVTPDVSPVDDDQQILNYVEATSQTTGVAQLARSTSSETTHGRYSASNSYLVATDAEALDRANWIVTNFAEPTTRYGTLTINLFNMAAAQASAVLAAVDVDCWLRVTGAPAQNTTGSTIDVVVESFNVDVGPGTSTITFNVLKRSLFDAVILDNATYGVLDASVARLAV